LVVRIGIDLGGSKIEAVALDDNNQLLIKQRVATPRQNYQATLDSICTLVTDIEGQLAGPATIGIGTPGSLSRHGGLIKNSNSTCLNQRPFQRDLEAQLKRTVRIANDANCFALSEASDGAGRDGAVVFGVILGTGVGGGLVVNKQLITGPNAIAGEWGHNPMPSAVVGEQQRACYCGRFNCVETFLSGPGLSLTHQQLSGTTLTAEHIAEQAQQGDQQAQASLAVYQRQLAAALATVINIIDPDDIVLGGGVSNIAQLYSEVPKLWCEWVFNDQVLTRLRQARHGDSSGVRGAAWLWPNNQ
jgi:predicted NBD/HSP70 family sugar kinase